MKTTSIIDLDKFREDIAKAVYMQIFNERDLLEINVEDLEEEKKELNKKLDKASKLRMKLVNDLNSRLMVSTKEI